MTAAPLSTYDALCRGVLLFPEGDVQRLALADWLNENEGTVTCGAVDCTNGKRNQIYRPKCPTCSGTGRVRNGNAERAELYRVGVELSQMTGADPNCMDRITDLDERLRELGMTRKDAVPCKNCWPESNRLRTRERELIAFGRTAEWWEIDGRARVEMMDQSMMWLTGPDYRVEDGVRFFIRRGSIDEIRLPAAALTEELARAIWSRFPVTKCVITNAVVHKSGGNDTYYLGGLGRFPAPYWRSLEGLPTRAAVIESCQEACVRRGRSLAGLTDSP